MHSILFSALMACVNMALLYWLSPMAAMILLVVEIVALFCLITKPIQWLGAIVVYGLVSLWVWMHFLAAMQQQIPLTWQNKIVRLDGTIISMVTADSVKQHFRVKASQICWGEQCAHIQGQIELNVYSQADHKINFVSGQSWILYARLKRLHRLANPSLLKPIEWAQGLYAVGSVLAYPEPKLIKPATGFNINRFRQILANRLLDLGLNENSLAVVLALSIGDRSHLAADLWSLFQQTGVLHLMAISGLHVGLLASFTYALMYLFLWPIPTVFQQLPRQKISLWAAILVAWAYGALAGFAVSTVRACIMISLYGLAKSASRSLSWLSVLLWSSVIILLVAPLQSLNISFWLSFMAVACIAFLLWVWRKPIVRLQQHIVMPLSLSLCLLPISWLFFQKSPLNAPLSNLIAIPWVSFIILPISLLALMVPSLFILAEWNIDYFLRFLQKMAQYLPYQWWHGNQVVSIGLMMGGLGLFLLSRAWQLRGIACLWLLSAIVALLPQTIHAALKVTVLDVGQGLAVVVQSRHHTLLYDTGPAYYGGGDAATSAIVPFLKRQGLFNLDALIVSHQDADHSGGVPSILKQLAVNTLISSPSQSPFVKKLYQHKDIQRLQLSECQAGQQWHWDGVDFKFLSPMAGVSDKKGNNLSCVLLIRVADGGLLLTGDIEQKVEYRLLQGDATDLRAQVLIAPHHGSITSSSGAFIQAIKPKIVVFSTGYLNRYHFPAKNVQKRYQSEGVLAYNTAYAGAIMFSFDTKGAMGPVTIVRDPQEQHENNTQTGAET